MRWGRVRSNNSVSSLRLWSRRDGAVRWNRSNGAAHLHSGNSRGIRIRLTTPVNSAIGTPILTKSMKP